MAVRRKTDRIIGQACYKLMRDLIIAEVLENERIVLE